MFSSSVVKFQEASLKSCNSSLPVLVCGKLERNRRCFENEAKSLSKTTLDIMSL